MQVDTKNDVAFLENIPTLTSEVFERLLKTLTSAIAKLETESAKVNILLDLINKRNDLNEDLLQGHVQINSYNDKDKVSLATDVIDTVLVSSRKDNVDSDMKETQPMLSTQKDSVDTDLIENKKLSSD